MDEIDVELMETGNEMPNQRPVFLKVLCILTFVGAGLSILGAIPTMLGFGMDERSMELAMRFSGLFDAVGFDIEQMIRWQTYIAYANFGGGLLCLGGALMMWQLKRIGYFIYVPGAIIPVVVGAIGMEYMMSGFMAGLGVAGVVINGIFSAAFIVMYGLNLKHLK